MANEISFSASLTCSKGGAQVASSQSGLADLSGSEMIGVVQELSTTGAAVNVTGLDQVQAILIYNMDSTISVTIGLTNGNPPTNVVSVLPPGKCIMLWAPATLYAAAASGTPNIFVVAIET